PGFRVPGYPLLPLRFIAAVSAVVVATLYDNPRNAGMGLLIMAAGVPVYFLWNRITQRKPTH
ncbi:MAG: amino acid permease, partial [Rhodanobacter sp.]